MQYAEMLRTSYECVCVCVCVCESVYVCVWGVVYVCMIQITIHLDLTLIKIIMKYPFSQCGPCDNVNPSGLPCSHFPEPHGTHVTSAVVRLINTLLVCTALYTIYAWTLCTCMAAKAKSIAVVQADYRP
jgi:hypothetical protein